MSRPNPWIVNNEPNYDAHVYIRYLIHKNIIPDRNYKVFKSSTLVDKIGGPATGATYLRAGGVDYYRLHTINKSGSPLVKIPGNEMIDLPGNWKELAWQYHNTVNKYLDDKKGNQEKEEKTDITKYVIIVAIVIAVAGLLWWYFKK